MAATLTSVTAGEATDAAVIEASLRDPAQFGVLYDRYAAQLYRYAHRRLGAQFAEDVSADVTARAAHGGLSAALAGLSTGDREVPVIVAWGEKSYEGAAPAIHTPV